MKAKNAKWKSGMADVINRWRQALEAQSNTVLYRMIARNWKVALYVILIVLCVLFAPEAPLKFIYTEF